MPTVLSHMNVVRVTGSALVHGPSADAVAALDADGGGSVADNEQFGTVAACLDDPLVALLSDHAFRGVNGPAAGFTAGAGVRGAAGTAPTEVLCRTARSDQEADQVRRHLESAVRGTSPATRRPWSTLLTGITVETVTGGDVPAVRLTAHPATGGADVLLRAAANGDLASLM